MAGLVPRLIKTTNAKNAGHAGTLLLKMWLTVNINRESRLQTSEVLRRAQEAREEGASCKPQASSV